MNNKSLKSLLQLRAEEMAPTSEINLWPSIQTRLSARHAVLSNSNGGSTMKRSFRAIALLVSIAIAVLLAFTLIAITPQGRALAQAVLSLFSQTETDQRPMPTDAAPVPTAVTPTASGSGAEDLTEWHVYQPAWLPEGYTFSNIDYRANSKLVVQTYTGKAIGMEAFYFYLGQQKVPFTEQWPVGKSAHIETVQIGDATGEYVVGVWGGEGDHLQWEENPSFQTLRWQENGYYFEISYSVFGVEAADLVNRPQYLSKEDLIAIADSMK